MASASVLRGAFDPESVRPADYDFTTVKADKKRKKEAK